MIVKRNQKKCGHTDGVICNSPYIGYEADEVFVNGKKVDSQSTIWVKTKDGKVKAVKVNADGVDFSTLKDSLQHQDFGPHEGGVKKCQCGHSCQEGNHSGGTCECSRNNQPTEKDEKSALVESIMKFNPIERLQKAIELGILYDEKSAKIREHNAGKSNYAHRLIQAWSIFEENPQLNYLECDIIKRLLRTKEEGGMTMLESRMLDIQKIKHIVSELERIYAIEIEKEKLGK